MAPRRRAVNHALADAAADMRCRIIVEMNDGVFMMGWVELLECAGSS
jgi:hypothetical protein